MAKPLVSIIIPTYNSEKTLPLCLKSIEEQTYGNIEVIVVDNFSRDKTVEVAKSYNALVIQARGERTKAKNLGLKRSRGSYVLFIDSDMELMPRVVEECVELAELNPRVAGVIIPERTVGNSYWARVRDFERSFYVETPIETPRFFKRDLALSVGGYDEDVVFYEEATLPYKLEQLGYRVRARVHSCILHHEEGFSLTTWLRKKHYYGKSARAYMRKYGGKYMDYLKAQVSPMYRLKLFFTNKKFWSTPHLALGVITLKTLEYFASALGYFLYSESK